MMLCYCCLLHNRTICRAIYSTVIAIVQRCRGNGVVDLWAYQRSYSTSSPVSTGIGDRLPRFVASHPGQLSILPSAGREMSTSQSAVMLCGWGVKAGMVPFTMDKRVGGR